MGETLTLPVPETLAATYAVAFAAPPADPRERAREQVARRIAPPARDLALRMLDSPLLALDMRPVSEFPPLPTDLLAAYGASRSELAAIAASSHVLAVRAAYRPGRPPVHEWAGRAIAGALGEGLTAPVIDVFTPQVLGVDRFRRSLPDADGTTRLTDWVLLPHDSGPHGFWFTTKGLARFGLPELHTENVPPPLVGAWARLLNGLAARLLALWLEELSNDQPVFVALPATVHVNLTDIATAHGDAAAGHRETEIRLRLDTTSEGHVLCVDGPDRPEALCRRLFGPP